MNKFFASCARSLLLQYHSHWFPSLQSLGLGSLMRGHNSLLRVCLSFPFYTQASKKIISLKRGLVIAEGIRGREGTKVHEDRSGAKNHVAVTLAIHVWFVTGAKDTRVTVAQTVVRCLWLFRTWRRCQVGHDTPPPLQSLTLLPLQLCLCWYPGILQHGFLSQVPIASASLHLFFLIYFRQPC